MKPPQEWVSSTTNATCNTFRRFQVRTVSFKKQTAPTQTHFSLSRTNFRCHVPYVAFAHFTQTNIGRFAHRRSNHPRKLSLVNFVIKVLVGCVGSGSSVVGRVDPPSLLASRFLRERLARGQDRKEGNAAAVHGDPVRSLDHNLLRQKSHHVVHRQGNGRHRLRVRGRGKNPRTNLRARVISVLSRIQGLLHLHGRNSGQGHKGPPVHLLQHDAPRGNLHRPFERPFHILQGLGGALRLHTPVRLRTVLFHAGVPVLPRENREDQGGEGESRQTFEENRTDGEHREED